MASIEDRLAINDLFVRYTTALDAGDVETIVGCFTEDGSLDSPTVGTYSGRSAIREFAIRFARFREGGPQLRHVISNLAVKLDGNRALATCYLSTSSPGTARASCWRPAATNAAWRRSTGNGCSSIPRDPRPRYQVGGRLNAFPGSAGVLRAVTLDGLGVCRVGAHIHPALPASL